MNYKDEYTDFAKDYDLFGEINEPNAAERDFLDAVLAECRAKTVLDCACGTGNHLVMLGRLGYAVSGSDYSGDMLGICRENLAKFGVEAETKQCDYRDLSSAWEGKFDAVLCLTQAINHMLTEEDLVRALSSMRERLNENGVLILTQSTTHRVLSDEFQFSLVVNTPAFTRILARDIDGGFQTIHVLDIFHSETKNEMKQHDIHIKIILDGEYRDLIAKAGFSKCEIWGGYDRSAYDRETSWKLIVAARP
jgi:glycine/sarcosine N-methyltransferase